MFKGYESLNLTDLILHEKKDGPFVVLLKDNHGNWTHTVDIDTERQVIYDCIEENELVLNEEKWSIFWCQYSV